MSDEEDARCPLRISRDLRDRIAASAEANSRSLNGEVAFRIEDYDRIVSLLKQLSGDNPVIAADFGPDDNAPSALHEVKKSILKAQASSSMTLDLVKEQGSRIDGIAGEVTAIRKLLEGALGRALTR